MLVNPDKFADHSLTTLEAVSEAIERTKEAVMEFEGAIVDLIDVYLPAAKLTRQRVGWLV